MLIALGVPNGNNGTNEMMATLAMISHDIGKMGHDMCYIGRDTACIDVNRNEIFETAQGLNADALLMIDTDISATIVGGIVKHLLDLNKDIITGIYYQGTYPYRPVVYSFTERGVKNLVDIPTEPIRVDATGGGFLWIGRKALYSSWSDKPGDKPFDIMYSPFRLHEDVAFCYRAKEKGLEIWATPYIELEHGKKQFISQKHFEAAKKTIVAADKVSDGGIDGWMTAEELQFLHDSAKKCRTVVEIGSWKGRSTKALLDTGATVFAVDHWKGSDTIEELASSQDVYSEFMQNVGHYKNLNVIRRPSLEAAPLFSTTVGMVFIDGLHTYEGCKADIEAWYDKTERIICGHDYSTGWPGVMRAVNERFGSKVKVVGTIWYIDKQEDGNGVA